MTNLNKIPEEVRINNRIQTYVDVTAAGSIRFKAQRKVTEKDKPPIINGQAIIEQGYYFGEWEDVTEQAKSKQTNIKPNKLEFKSAKDVALEKEEELRKAIELLKKLEEGI